MKLTKYGHACFTVEQDGHTIVVDPGHFSSDFTPNAQISAVIITHEHGDHFNPDALAAIYAKNPEVLLLADQAIIDQLPDYHGQAVRAGDTLSVDGFDLEFFGGTHAEIHASIPHIPNVGVLINNLLYYPGDSFALPNRPIDTLALPAAAPWMKISEAMDFLIAIKPRVAFPTHDAILSHQGKHINDTLLGQAAEKAGTNYQRLQDTIEIK